MSDDVVVNPQGDLVVIPPHTDGNVVGRGVIDLINEVSDRVDGIESGGGAGPQGPAGPQGIPGPEGPQGVAGAAGPTVYPASGMAVSTGTAWETSIDPATVPHLNTSNTFTASQSLASGILISGVLSIDSRSKGATINADSANMFINSPAGAGSIYFNWDLGSGVHFGNGADVEVASVDSAGNAHFNGTITSGAVNVTEVIAELQARVAALETK